ncbi:LINE-1 retrotransposable element ORF1 protein [Plecturocebus cupreus]
MPVNPALREAEVDGSRVQNIETILANMDRRFNDEIDKLTGYKTKSLLCMPIRSSDGEIIGVAQAINKIPEGAPFTEDDEKVLERNINELMELKNTTRELREAYTSVPECDGENESKLENTLQHIIQENFPNLARQANIQVQEIQRTPQRYFSIRATPRHIIVRFTRVEMKEKMLRVAREKGRLPTKGSPSDSQRISQQKPYKPEESRGQHSTSLKKRTFNPEFHIQPK